MTKVNNRATEATLAAVRAVLLNGWYLTEETGHALGRPSKHKWVVCDRDGKLVAYGADAERAVFRAWESFVFASPNVESQGP